MAWIATEEPSRGTDAISSSRVGDWCTPVATVRSRCCQSSPRRTQKGADGRWIRGCDSLSKLTASRSWISVLLLVGRRRGQPKHPPRLLRESLAEIGGYLEERRGGRPRRRRAVGQRAPRHTGRFDLAGGSQSDQLVCHRRARRSRPAPRVNRAVSSELQLRVKLPDRNGLVVRRAGGQRERPRQAGLSVDRSRNRLTRPAEPG